LLAAIGLAFYAVCFLATRETVAAERRAARPAWRESGATLAANRALHTLCLAALCALLGAGSQSASAMYFARYVLGDARHFMTFALTSTPFGLLAAVLLGPLLTARLGKRTAFQCGMALAAAANLLLFFLPASPAPVFACLAVGSAGLMLAMVTLWALENDTVEYGEWKTGVRLGGLNYSLFSLTRKCGLALGGSLPAFLLAGAAYAPNQPAQPPAVLEAIRQALALVPSAAFLGSLLVMFLYPLSDRRFLEIVREIEARRPAP
jgi:glucuronide carrier protein